jgi:hypothetical protein
LPEFGGEHPELWVRGESGCNYPLELVPGTMGEPGATNAGPVIATILRTIQLALKRKIPQTLQEVDLPGRIRAAGGANLKEAGDFFGWEPAIVIKAASDFTKHELLAKGGPRNGCWMSLRVTNTSPESHRATRAQWDELTSFEKSPSARLRRIPSPG